MTKARIFWFLLLLLPLLSLGQQHHIKHFLSYNRSNQTLSGYSTISFKAGLYNDSVLLHLPSRSLEHKGSFLHHQFADFQNVEAYYAKAEELGHITITAFTVNDAQCNFPQQSEFGYVHLPANNRDSVTLYLEYNLQLPTADFTATHANIEEGQFIDWLPRLAAQDSGGWLAYPVTFTNDAFLPLDSIEFSLGLESQLQPITNLKVQHPAKELTPYFTRHYFAGTSRNLQVYWGSQWHTYPLASGTQIYSRAPSLFLELKAQEQAKNISRFFKNELNDSLQQAQTWVYLPKKYGEYQSAEMLSLELPGSVFEMANELAHARAQAAFRYFLHPNGFKHVWLARGLPYYYKYRFIQSYFPNEYWVPFGDSWWGRLLDFDQFDYSYQNQFLYLFLARQGLDQAISTPLDSLSRLNYEGISQGKTFLLFNHLRGYLGETTFKRSMARYIQLNRGKTVNPQDLEAALTFYSNQPITWFFQEGVHSAERFDYQLATTDHCPTVTTATVINRGKLNLPYSITGYKNGEKIITEWFQGHSGKRNVQLYNEDFDKVVLNDHLRNTEYRQKNNSHFPNQLLKRAEPLNFALYNSFEKAEATQVFYVPHLTYNAYDKLLLGLSLSNTSVLVPKPFEYQVTPTLSTGTWNLTGSASALWNYTLPKKAFFRQISAGIFGRYFHYDDDLSFLRLSPSLVLRLRKPYPKSNLIRSIRLRGVSVNRELAPLTDFEEPSQLSGYTVFQAGYRLEYTSIFNPTIFRINLEVSEKFSKAYLELDQRYMLPNRKWFIFRLFGGAFLNNQLANQALETNLFNFGLSGTQDYLFDYYFIGRSDTRGLWSRQFFTTDGGFKTQTNVFASDYLVSSNISLPLYSFIGLFADGAYADGQTYWDYGVRLAFLTDFVELYLPFQNQDVNFLSSPHYLENLRFVLDLDLGNIINRLRRGYY
jgi:hypothetical protein